MRVEKSSGTRFAQRMYWPGPAGETLAETDLSGNINEEYIYFNGARIARVDRPSGAVHYYFSDHLGSASVIADSLGNVELEQDFFPYGAIAYTSGSDPNHYKFTGKERDTESNLDTFGARYYTSNIGRFMTPDWAAKPVTVPYAKFGDPQTLNLYAMVANNPESFADLDGHDPPLAAPGAGLTPDGKPEDCANDQQKCEAQTSGATIGKGVGEVGVGAGLITLAILGAPETGGGSLAALGIFSAVMGGEAEIGKGAIDIANGSGAIDTKTAENGKQGVGLATNPVSAIALPFTGAKTAEQLGNVANGALGAHDLATRPKSIAEGISKVFAARDVKEGYQSAKELLHQANTWLMNKAMSLTPYF